MEVEVEPCCAWAWASQKCSWDSLCEHWWLVGLLTFGQPTSMPSWDHMGAQGADGTGPGPLLYKSSMLLSQLPFLPFVLWGTMCYWQVYTLIILCYLWKCLFYYYVECGKLTLLTLILYLSICKYALYTFSQDHTMCLGLVMILCLKALWHLVTLLLFYYIMLWLIPVSS